MGNVFWGVHGAAAASAPGHVLIAGDSWMWYPLDNLAVELGNLFPNHSFVVMGRNGAEAADWSTRQRKEIDFGFRMYAAGAQALILSGGGNDVAGMSDFLRLLRDDCRDAQDPLQCYRIAQPSAVLASIEGHYRALIARFRAHNAHAPILVHHYDYAWPSGMGVFGPGDWLKAPMDRAGVPAQLREGVFRSLIEHFRDRQLGMADERALGIDVVMSAGTLDKDMWANELHPTPAGFERLATQAFAPVLRPHLN